LGYPHACLHRYAEVSPSSPSKDCPQDVSRLWELAKVAHPKLQVHFFYHNVKRAAEETNTYHTTESELANWHKVRAYQILRKESGLPMDFTRNELEDMVSDTRWASLSNLLLNDCESLLLMEFFQRCRHWRVKVLFFLSFVFIC
ncbi:hypothetical protein KCV01_g85, partial [Aureobasidium melanogenum]